jgi:hypothetical protein
VGVSKHAIYARKAKCGGMTVTEAQEAKQLRDENTRLRKPGGGSESGQGDRRFYRWNYVGLHASHFVAGELADVA